jgi:hypothetical protein
VPKEDVITVGELVELFQRLGEHGNEDVPVHVAVGSRKLAVVHAAINVREGEPTVELGVAEPLDGGP